MEGDTALAGVLSVLTSVISIHALRVEGDRKLLLHLLFGVF